MSQNYNIKDLTEKISAMNQMRNNVYHLIKFMQEKGLSDQDIKSRLKRMGRNIGKTMNIIFKFQKNNVEEILKDIYKILLHSKVNIYKENNVLTVEDSNCALCKYYRQDINIPPDTIIPAMVAEIMSINGYKVIDSVVISSKSLGDTICVHKYEFVGGSI